MPRQRTERSDGIENRQRILAAATTVIARDGVQVPLASVAAAAGVGVGTLYRHFPNRAALLDGLAVRSFRLVLDAITAAAAECDDAIGGLREFYRRTIEHREQLILPLHGAPGPLGPSAVALQQDIRRVVDELLRRDGSIRPGVTSGDIILFGAMLAQPLPAVTDWDRSAHRMSAIFLAGLSR
jgi:AcrR family transcriptional regulator